jgi:hypothetical protein
VSTHRGAQTHLGEPGEPLVAFLSLVSEALGAKAMLMRSTGKGQVALSALSLITLRGGFTCQRQT